MSNDNSYTTGLTFGLQLIVLWLATIFIALVIISVTIFKFNSFYLNLFNPFILNLAGLGSNLYQCQNNCYKKWGIFQRCLSKYKVPQSPKARTRDHGQTNNLVSVFVQITHNDWSQFCFIYYSDKQNNCNFDFRGIKSKSD